MRTLTLIVLLTTSQFTYAISPAESECLARNVYHEARSLSRIDWLKVARVLLNRKLHYNEKRRFHAKSNNLCDLAQSREYTSRLTKPIKERKVYREIVKTMRYAKAGGKDLFFTTRKGKMIYR